MKILLIGSQHGDELLGEKLFSYIKSYRPELSSLVDFYLANPLARSQRKRYVETDMNRSYKVGTPASYEEIRAEELRKHIETNNFDLVLDMHTTTCIQPACLIVPNMSAIRCKYIAASKFSYIVVMESTMVKNSLIGVCNNAISVEVSRQQVCDIFLKLLADSIQQYEMGVVQRMNRKIYVVKETLLKNEISPYEERLLRNFVKSPAGYYPVLIGENTYKRDTPYMGFKAKIMKQIRL